MTASSVQINPMLIEQGVSGDRGSFGVIESQAGTSYPRHAPVPLPIPAGKGTFGTGSSIMSVAANPTTPDASGNPAPTPLPGGVFKPSEYDKFSSGSTVFKMSM